MFDKQCGKICPMKLLLSIYVPNSDKSQYDSVESGCLINYTVTWIFCNSVHQKFESKSNQIYILA